MPNARRQGWRVASFSAPAELVAAAQARAEENDETLSAVIRRALAEYLEEKS